MSEMLGNQYFLSRNFSKAKDVYEKIALAEPENYFVKKRLIICYTQTGEINKAFDLFYEIVKKDIEIISGTDIKADDCPCPELINRYGIKNPIEECSHDAKLMMGMLWLYCDSKVAFEFFENLSSEENADNRINEVKKIIENKLIQNEKHYS
jgi:pentatricopeptide repeat protein